MTHEQLEAECVKESTHWVDAGSGQLGRIFVEILGCDDLPNLDTGGFAGNKTDAFVSLVFEVRYNLLSFRARFRINGCFHLLWEIFCGVFLDWLVSREEHDSLMC